MDSTAKTVKKPFYVNYTKRKGKKTRKHKEWLTTETWALNTERKRVKDRINQTQVQQEKQELQACYWDKNPEVKRSARTDKKSFMTQEAETAADQKNMKRLYEITRTLSGKKKNSKPSRPVKDKNGNTILREEDQRARRTEHFNETLNRLAPSVPFDIPHLVNSLLLTPAPLPSMRSSRS